MKRIFFSVSCFIYNGLILFNYGTKNEAYGKHSVYVEIVLQDFQQDFRF
jgi:hypothetical protein